MGINKSTNTTNSTARKIAHDWLENNFGVQARRLTRWWGMRKYRQIESERVPYREKAISTLRREHSRFESRGMQNYAEVFNVGLFILCLDHDLNTLVWSYQEASNDWRAKYSIRQLATELYEASNDVPQILGKFRRNLDTLKLWENSRSDLNKISQELDLFKKNNRTELQKIRNMVGAHRHHNMTEVFAILDEISPIRIIALTGNFSESLRKLVTFMIKTTEHLRRLDNMLKHTPFEDRTRPDSR